MPETLDATIDDLELDPNNQRLPDEHQGANPDALLRIMARDYALIELARSFADNGYFRQEPLVAIRQDGALRVVEGNRRLAALKILGNPAVAETLGLDPEWMQLSGRWSDRREHTIPVLVYDNYAEVLPFLGFRHISGIKKWEPVEKARFLNALLEPGTRTFAEVARMTGSRANSVRDNFVAYRIARQARDEFGVDTSKLEDSFGVFLRAMSSAPVKRHIGVDASNREPADLLRPVPPEREPELREIVGWMFGIGSRNPVMRDSRQITKLGYILSAPQALEALRASGDFELALALTEGEELSLLDNLSKASYYLDEIKRDIDRHRESGRVRELVDRLQRSLDSILVLAGIDTGPDGS